MLQIEGAEFDAVADGIRQMFEMIVRDVAGSEARQSANPGRKLRDLVLAKRQRRYVLRN